jgi:hypothetical protein
MKRFLIILTISLFARSHEAVSEEMLLARLKVLAGLNAVSCGIVTRRVNESQDIDCARKALTAKKPFWVAELFQGLDSVTWNGVVLTPDGNVRLLEYSIGLGEPEDLIEILCREVQFLPGQIKCLP